MSSPEKAQQRARSPEYSVASPSHTRAVELLRKGSKQNMQPAPFPMMTDAIPLSHPSLSAQKSLKRLKQNLGRYGVLRQFSFDGLQQLAAIGSNSTKSVL